MAVRQTPRRYRPEAGGPPRERPARRDGGQMMLLSGVLLLLGFVVMGTTLVQLQGLEGSTERTQRDSLMETAENLIAGLNQTISDSVVIGDTNTTGFQESLRSAEKSLRDNAVRAGVYASVKLSVIPVDDPEMKDIFWRQSRCIGYNAQDSQDGLILGWEAESLQETIAGAVYDVHITDGKQTFRSLVYVKLVDCADIEVTSTYTFMNVVHGTITDPTAMRKENGQSANLTEELDLDTMVQVMVHPTINQTSITTAGNWNSEDNLLQLNGAYTTIPSNLATITDELDNLGNYHQFFVEPPERMRPGDTIPNVTLEVTGFKDKDDALDVQDLMVLVYENSASEVPLVAEPIEFNVTEANAGTTTVILENLQPGEDNWTYEQIVDSKWRLSLVGLHLASQKYNIDHFNMTGGLMMSQGYRLNVSMDWQDIPSQYQDHELYLKYKLTPATVDEGFLLQVRDRAVPGSSWTEVYNMTSTVTDPNDGMCVWDSGWCSVVTDPATVEIPHEPEFRIVDTVITDNWIPEDQDSLFIEHFFVKSWLELT